MFDKNPFRIHLLRRSLILSAFFLLCTGAYAVSESTLMSNAMTEQQLFDHLMRSSTDSASTFQKTGKPLPRSQFEQELLGDTWRLLLQVRNAKADPHVLKLLNYDWDGFGNENVLHSLQCRGKRMLPALRKAKKQGLQCEAKYQPLCDSPDGWNAKVKKINEILMNHKNSKDGLQQSRQFCLDYYSRVMSVSEKKRN